MENLLRLSASVIFWLGYKLFAGLVLRETHAVRDIARFYHSSRFQFSRKYFLTVSVYCAGMIISRSLLNPTIFMLSICFENPHIWMRQATAALEDFEPLKKIATGWRDDRFDERASPTSVNRQGEMLSSARLGDFLPGLQRLPAKGPCKSLSFVAASLFLALPGKPGILLRCAIFGRHVTFPGRLLKIPR